MPNDKPFNASTKRQADKLNAERKPKAQINREKEDEQTKQLSKEIKEGKIWYPDLVIKGEMGSGWDGRI